MPKKLTTDEFIKKANQIHNNYYSYEQTNYVDTNIMVDITCPVHGVYKQKPKKHLHKKRGCKKCADIKNGAKKTKTLDKFVQDARTIHGNKYDYSQVDYVNNNTQVSIICKSHGVFLQTPHDHLGNHGCTECQIELSADARRKPLEQFIKDAIAVHGDTYDYSKVIYEKSDKNVIIICPKHKEFLQTPCCHTNAHHGCPLCQESKGARKISNFLETENIEYKREKRFDDCRHKRPLPFDFYLPKYNICLEYDGEQHYFGWKGHRDTLESIRFRDNIKTNYCKTKGINLLRIPYTKFDEIEIILSSFIKGLA